MIGLAAWALLTAAEAAARPGFALKGNAAPSPGFSLGTTTNTIHGITRDTVPPYVSFPDPELDDPAAYAGYTTRLYRDARGNALQVYLSAATGRVVNLWADAADESLGFTARDSSGGPAMLAWASSGAVVTSRGRERALAYTLQVGPAPVTLGLFLLGSMRVERDLHYQGRDTLPAETPAFPEPELLALLADLEGLDPAERRREVALLGARSVAELRARLEPTISVTRTAARWTARITQPRFDGRTHLALELSGDARTTAVTPSGRTVTIRPLAGGGGPVLLAVRVGTDAPALTPLGRGAIFNDAFLRFAARVGADPADPVRARRLEREIRGMELLCYREKLMAGLPNFATYFGRDMLMTALLMQPVWAPEMSEHVVASALDKLSPDGDVSHEEALAGQAIRENATRYDGLVRAGRIAEARAVLAQLGATRENYIMVDDDVQLPLVAARYLTDPRVPAARKRRFLVEGHRLERLLANLEYVARAAARYADDPVPTNLVSFPKGEDGRWISASWRDSRVGYAGGRFAMDVNVIWTPRALASVGVILDALRGLGLSPKIRDEPLAGWARDGTALARAVAVWRGAERHFEMALGPDEALRRIRARLAWLPEAERDFWDGVLERVGEPRDTVRFLALALDAVGRPIPVVNTDPAMLLLVDTLTAARVRDLIGPILAPYPMGLFVDGLGPLVANDTYADSTVWNAFRRDPYHSPTVVWGRDVNILLAGLARQTVQDSGTAGMLRQIVTAVDRSGLRHAELWSYRLDGGRLVPARYGTSSDVQLWSLTDLAVQYLLQPTAPTAPTAP